MDENLALPTDAPTSQRSDSGFKTALGQVVCGDSSLIMAREIAPKSVDLIVTSPPFGLVRKKAYGNENADDYLEWFKKFAVGFQRVLAPKGSLVIDIGGSWVSGLPVRSLYHFELLIMLCKEFGFHLAQDFYWWNPAKLPTPAEWVTVRRIRVKDAINCVWWLSLDPYPRASNRRVLAPYSDSMHHLLKHGYRAKLRPSGHAISTKFQRDNGGAIPPNLIAIANTKSSGNYERYCKAHSLPEHPARFPSALPRMFMGMLTDPGDLVLDPFGGSCVTGEVAESMGRRWICCELDPAYVQGAQGRFQVPSPRDRSRRNQHSGPHSPDLAAGLEAPKYEIYSPVTRSDSEALPKDGGKSRPISVQRKAKAG